MVPPSTQHLSLPRGESGLHGQRSGRGLVAFVPRLSDPHLEQSLVQGRGNTIYIYGLRQGDLAEHSPLAELAEMYRPVGFTMLMSGFSLYNHGVRERRHTDVFDIESRQRELKLKFPVAFREFYAGHLE